VRIDDTLKTREALGRVLIAEVAAMGHPGYWDVRRFTDRELSSCWLVHMCLCGDMGLITRRAHRWGK
jgi:hypothetical protein